MSLGATSPSRPGARATVAGVLAFLALFVMTQLPMYVVQHPDMGDFPNHVARLHVLTQLGADPWLARHYRFEPGWSPNMAMDVLAWPLARLVGPVLALKLFISLAVFTLASGTALLGRALHGRWTALSLAGLMFAHGAFVHFGLANFILGTGCALVVLSAWLRLRARPGPMVHLAMAAGVALAYLCHLSAAGVALLGIAAIEWSSRAGEPVARRAAYALASPMLYASLALAVHFALYQQGISQPGSLAMPPLRVWLAYKLSLPIYLPFIAAMLPPLAAAGGFAAWSVGMHAASQAGHLRWDAAGLTVAAVLGLAALVLPPLGFGSAMVDQRPLLAGLLCMVAAATPTGGRRAQAGWFAAVSVTVALSSLLVGVRWHDADARHAALRRAMLAFEPGVRVAVVDVGEEAGRRGITPHAVAWSVLDRSAFVSSMYLRPYQPFFVGYAQDRAAAARLARLDNDAPPPALQPLQGHYDYAVVFGTPEQAGGHAQGWPQPWRADFAVIADLRARRP